MPSGLQGRSGAPLDGPLDEAAVVRLARASMAGAARGTGEILAGVRTRGEGSRGVRPGVDVEDLAAAGWAAVFPAVRPQTPEAERQAKILADLAPLLDLRRRQATAAKPQRFRLLAGAEGFRGAGHPRPEDKWSFCQRIGAPPGLVDPDCFPYYVLLVGSPDELPFDLQHQLDVQYAVGRLDLEEEGWARYAANVAQAELHARPGRRRAAFVGPRHEGDVATARSREQLVLPLAAWAAAREDVDAEVIEGPAATRGRVLELLHDAPDILFYAGHGIGLDSDDPDRRALQGALVPSDWARPTPPADVAVTAACVGDDADLRGTVAFLFACFGLGTPAAPLPPAEALSGPRPPVEGGAPFTSALPRRLLGAPRGALAVIGHVDRAWDCAFEWRAADGAAFRAARAHFEDALGGLLGGGRVGAALEAFHQRHADLLAALAPDLQRLPYPQFPTRPGFGKRWLAQEDARAWALLGDPAVRLTGRLTGGLTGGSDAPLSGAPADPPAPDPERGAAAPPADPATAAPPTEDAALPSPPDAGPERPPTATPLGVRWVRTWRLPDGTPLGGDLPAEVLASARLYAASRVAPDGTVDTWVEPAGELGAIHAAALASLFPPTTPPTRTRP